MDRTAEALDEKADALMRLGRREEAIATWDKLVTAYRESPEIVLRRRVAEALVSKGVVMDELGYPRRAIAAYDELAAGGVVGRAPEPTLGQHVAKAMVNKAVRQHHDRRAIAIYDEVIERFTGTSELEVQESVALALYNKGVVLVRSGRLSEAVKVYDEVVTAFAEAPELTLRELVVKSLVNKGLALSSESRITEAIESYDRVLTLLHGIDEPVAWEQSALALLSKARAFRDLGRWDEGNKALDELLQRFGKLGREANARGGRASGARPQTGQLVLSEIVAQARTERVARRYR